MQIKRFEAKNMQEALLQVKKALGPEAIILSTKTLKKAAGGPGPARAAIEVVAGIDPQSPADKAPAPPSAGQVPERPGSAAEEPLPVDAFLQRVRSAGFVPDFVTSLADGLRKRRNGRAEKPPADPRGFLKRHLMEAVDVAGPEINRSRLWAFIGPTGVGKTTTLAKLAAHFSLREGRKVALVTADTYRIGAVEQLQTYARILKLPLEIAAEREDLGRIIGSFGERDLILIDTAGRNPFHGRQLQELKDLLAIEEPIAYHLVLSATTKDGDLARIVHHFSLFPFVSYVFTKIDETEEYTSLFNQLWRDRKPLSFLTTGQKVPEDIEVASKGRVANLVLQTIPWN
jgi:flagellar biosynthesis protein FlhF